MKEEQRAPSHILEEGAHMHDICSNVTFDWSRGKIGRERATQQEKMGNNACVEREKERFILGIKRRRLESRKKSCSGEVNASWRSWQRN